MGLPMERVVRAFGAGEASVPWPVVSGPRLRAWAEEAAGEGEALAWLDVPGALRRFPSLVRARRPAALAADFRELSASPLAAEIGFDLPAVARAYPRVLSVAHLPRYLERWAASVGALGRVTLRGGAGGLPDGATKTVDLSFLGPVLLRGATLRSSPQASRAGAGAGHGPG